jgi:hypothetical protein
MKKFIVLYNAPVSAMEKMKNMSPEDHKKGMEPWMAWVKKCGDGIVDMGTPFGNGQKVTKSENSLSDSDIVGYSILQAESMDEAVEMMQGHPHLELEMGCEIEVFESMPMPK